MTPDEVREHCKAWLFDDDGKPEVCDDYRGAGSSACACGHKWASHLLVHAYRLLEEQAADLASLRATLETREQELAYWKVCENCGEPMEGPGICSKAVSEREHGQEQMIEGLLTRAEKAEQERARQDRGRADSRRRGVPGCARRPTTSD